MKIPAFKMRENRSERRGSFNKPFPSRGETEKFPSIKRGVPKELLRRHFDMSKWPVRRMPGGRGVSFWCSISFRESNHVKFKCRLLLQQNHLPRPDEIACLPAWCREGLEAVEIDALLLDLRTCFLLQLSYFRATFPFSDAEFHPATNWFGSTMKLLWSSCCKEPVPSPSMTRIVMMPLADSSERTAETPRSTRAPR